VNAKVTEKHHVPVVMVLGNSNLIAAVAMVQGRRPTRGTVIVPSVGGVAQRRLVIAGTVKALGGCSVFVVKRNRKLVRQGLSASAARRKQLKQLRKLSRNRSKGSNKFGKKVHLPKACQLSGAIGQN